MPPSGIDEDALYKLSALPLWLEGLELKDPKVGRRVQELLRVHDEKIEYKRRKLSDGYTRFVYQLSEKPPAYCIHPYFEGIWQIAQELTMPGDLDRLYFLRYFHGGDFLKYKKRSFEKIKRYTVEALGVRIRLPEVTLSQYKYPPMYWHEDRWCQVQIWRIRVFDCALETIQIPLSNPLNPYMPPVLKFEWRWHPNNDPKLNFCEPQHLRIPHARFLSFSKYCNRITGSEIKPGRPKEYADPNCFVQDLIDAYQKLKKRTGEPPNRTLIAEELQIDRKTLYTGLKGFKAPWPPC